MSFWVLKNILSHRWVNKYTWHSCGTPASRMIKLLVNWRSKNYEADSRQKSHLNNDSIIAADAPKTQTHAIWASIFLSHRSCLKNLSASNIKFWRVVWTFGEYISFFITVLKNFIISHTFSFFGQCLNKKF